MITLKQKIFGVESVARLPIIIEVIAILGLFTNYSIQSVAAGLLIYPFPTTIWLTGVALLIDIFAGTKLRLMGLAVKLLAIFIYFSDFLPYGLSATVLGSLLMSIVACFCLFLLVILILQIRDKLGLTYLPPGIVFDYSFDEIISFIFDKFFKSEGDFYLQGRWFSLRYPFAPLERGGYFYKKQISYIDRICQISAEVKNECSIYSDRVGTIGTYMVLGVLAALIGVSIFFISQEPKELVIIYNCIGVIVLIILLILAKVTLFKDIDQQISLIQSGLCDCLDSAIVLDTLVSQKATLLPINDSGLTIAAWGEAITTQINTIVDALSLFSKDLEKLNLMSLENTRKVRRLTQIDALNTILNEVLLEKTQLARIYVKEMIGKYKEALQLYTEEMPISESAAGAIATVRLGEIIRSFEAIHIEPMSHTQS